MTGLPKVMFGKSHAASCHDQSQGTKQKLKMLEIMTLTLDSLYYQLLLYLWSGIKSTWLNIFEDFQVSTLYIYMF